MKNNIFLYERFDNKKNFFKLKNKFRLIKIDSKKKFEKKNVKIIFVKLKFYLDRKFLLKFKNLKYILSPTTGLNHIDQEYCKNNDIEIIYFDKRKRKLLKNISSTTELSLTFILSAVKKINFFFDDVKKCKWDRYCQNLYQFKNYSVGIIGLGRIGKSISIILRNLGFKILTFDKRSDNKKKLNYLLKESDIISFHIDAESNLNFLDKKKLKLCKKNVSIINTSRGEIVNEKDLINFLKKNKDSSAFIDVIKNEQKELHNLKKNSLIKYHKLNKNLYITPHIGGVSRDALIYTENLILKQLQNKIINEK